ncbi:hypothetical protein WKU36_00050 [Blautia sp. ICN-22010]|uniref:hypothetical protein n=1 Tax=Blautia sp. ICN-22010 TaxID=3134653 RepID=UPI0030C27C6C
MKQVPCSFLAPSTGRKEESRLPCPHHDVKIIQRSKGQSAVASAAYQSGERLFSEYDQKQKYNMLPPHAPPEYANPVELDCRKQREQNMRS